MGLSTSANLRPTSPNLSWMLRICAVLSPHGVKATLIPVYVSANGIPAVVTGAAGRAILLHMQQISAPLGTRLTISGDRAYVRSSGA